MTWLTGYDKRIKITTKSTKVDSDLMDFPLGLTLSSGCGIYSQDMTAIFDEVGNDYTKIAITSYDGETILPAEVEYWNEEVKEAQLWFKAPNVYSAADTDFYLYYDATASGNTLIDTNEDAITYQVSVSIGSEGTYDTAGVYFSSIIKDGDVYKMWYSGKDSTNWRILYCTSTDGINWSNFQMVVDKGSEGTYDTFNADMPFVLKDDGVYKMWYGGYNSTNYRILYCTSTDGINWSNFQMVVDKGSEGTYDTTHCMAPAVVKEDGLYKMWYSGYNSTNYRTLYCTSTDGINWSNFQMVVDKGSEGTYDTTNAVYPFVLKDDGVYKMWYGGYNSTNYRILYCTSTDGINWSNFQMVVDKGSEGTYDTIYSHSPFILEEEGFYKMWYTGYNGTNFRIIYTSSPTPEWKTATQSVWDSSYKAVYHMNNNPSGGAGCIKDSTSNKNHGTPGGSMTSDDLINGRAIEFDGVDDYIGVSGFTIGADPIFTITSFFKPLVSVTSAGFWGLGSGSAVKYGVNCWNNTATNKLGIDLWGTTTYVGHESYSVGEFSHGVWIKKGTGDFVAGLFSLYLNAEQQILTQMRYTSGSSDVRSGLVLGRLALDSYLYHLNIQIGDFRISNTVRSESWVEVENYTIIDSLLYFTEDQIPYDYIFRGIIKEKGVPVQRRVCAYRRSTNLLAGSTTSSVDGYYYITTPYNEEHYIVVLDNDLGDDYNALIQDRVCPSLT